MQGEEATLIWKLIFGGNTALMQQRFGIQSPVTALGPIAARYARALSTAGISTLRDLLFYYPYRYEDWSNVRPLRTLVPGIEATLQGMVSSITARRVPWRRQPNAEAKISDDEGNTVNVVWFNSSFLPKTLPAGTRLILSGKVERMKGSLTLIHPQWEKITEHSPQGKARLVPVYHLSGRLTQKVLRFLAAAAFKRLARVPDHLPPWMLTAAKLMPLNTALRSIHLPADWTALRAAEQRLKFDELFFLQLRSALARRRMSQLASTPLPFTQEKVKSFVAHLPFALTQAQRKAAWEIIKDLEKPHPMNRLLEGDVGSGKTAVAAIAAFNVVTAGHQVAYLAPTSILAVQHFETFCKLFNGMPVTVALLTQGMVRIWGPASAVKRAGVPANKKELKKKLAEGTIDIVIGTHALLSETVQMPKLALVIVDEQHRFGVRQRHLLLQKGSVVDISARGPRKSLASLDSAGQAASSEWSLPRSEPKALLLGQKEMLATVPHLLSMTATPIPRSLALVAYGDLDLSILDERPLGRAPIATNIVTLPQRPEAYALIHDELSKGRQAFIICPLIDPSDTLGVKSVKLETERLMKEHFPHASLAPLHGRMGAEKKDAVMKDFSDGKIQVLVATPVVEVGIDVPNATVILIEGAERFGLAQLHQLRGRVGRSTHPSYCLLASDTESEEARERLHAVVASQDGFALAEKDLAMRGPGEVYGTTQAGFLDNLKIAKLTDAILLKQSKEAVVRLLNADPDLAQYPAIKERLASLEQSVHLE